MDLNLAYVYIYHGKIRSFLVSLGYKKNEMWTVFRLICLYRTNDDEYIRIELSAIREKSI